MQKLPVSRIIQNITEEIPFEAVADDYAFTIKVEKYVPYICGAVHDGHQFRKSLWADCLHSEYDRWYEEDPGTKEMIATQPIVLAGRDSRFEYDLNRDPENALYENAWGKKLWKRPLPKKEREHSLQKHAAFYKVVDALVHQIERKYGKAIVFDMHSYNLKRWDRPVPTWNLGTGNIDNGRFGELAESWRLKLAGMQLPNGIPSPCKINDTFQGNGHFLKYITKNFGNTLVLATEIAKIYCDEESGIMYPEVVASVQNQLNKLIPLQVEEFMSENKGIQNSS
ncbi:MAG TPA: N-formylglutamate amidohydrolase [Pricia sp.]|nr:N-formylglutamate amidohydrolase [Pricia sp.]